ncbi:MAG: aldo/keto reductase [Candidatus Sulfopaludibacter sp.]|nr:aldo/keto reductase [Candidatus Sulfopaludibacter sp.]
MQKVRLGSSNLEVSALCFGTDLIGSKIDRQTSFRLLDLFREAGGTFIDTGNFYASWLPGCKGGESETTIGLWMKERGNRQEMVISTKLGFDYPGCPGGLSAAEIERECEKSLRRLGTDRLDLYQAHRDDPETPLDETMEAFDRLIRAGKVRAIGASNLRAWHIAEANTVANANGWARYSVVEQRHTYLRPRHGADFGPQICINDDVRSYCRSRNIALIGYSTLLQGAYTRPDRAVPLQYAGPDSDARLAVLKGVAEEAGATLNQAVIAWMLQSDPPVLPIIAGSQPAQVSENLAALNVRLSGEQMRRLDTAGDPEIKQAWLR